MKERVCKEVVSTGSKLGSTKSVNVSKKHAFPGRQDTSSFLVKLCINKYK